MEKTYEMLQQYAVNSLEYQKGRALHQRGQAALSSAEEAHGRTQIQATVRDLSRRYDVEMTIQSTGLAADGNWGDFDIEESLCSCGEYHTPGKLCRHEIAAVLQYFSYIIPVFSYCFPNKPADKSRHLLSETAASRT